MLALHMRKVFLADLLIQSENESYNCYVVLSLFSTRRNRSHDAKSFEVTHAYFIATEQGELNTHA